MPSNSAQTSFSGSRRVLVIIPTYNERANLPDLLKKIPSIASLEVLFVDDHSNDGTAEWIREVALSNPSIHLMERSGKLGLGTAYIEGFKWALKRDYVLIFEMDADLSHNPAEIPNFIAKIESGADLVIGSRYLNGIRITNWPISRLMLSRFAASYTRFWTGLPLTDPTSGFKCFHRKILERLNLDGIRSNGYSFQIEVDFYAWKQGFRLAEIPITFEDRHYGSSKMNYAIVREAVCLVPRLYVQNLWKRISANPLKK